MKTRWESNILRIVSKLKKDYGNILKGISIEAEPIRVYVGKEEHVKLMPSKVNGIKILTLLLKSEIKERESNMFLQIIKDERTNRIVEHKLLTKEEIKEKHPTNHDLNSWIGSARIMSRFSVKNYIYVRTDERDKDKLKQIVDRIFS